MSRLEAGGPLSLSDVAIPAVPATPITDAELVARIRAGDESACGALYLAYHDPLWRFAYGHVRSRDVAEDLVQDVFLALRCGRGSGTCGRRRARGRPPSSPRPAGPK
jgi:hypothetical protein